jgi:hypothetical protein
VTVNVRLVGAIKMAGLNADLICVIEAAIAATTGPGIGIMSLNVPYGDVTLRTSN